MKKHYKIHFTLSWSTVAFLALLLLACKSCTPAHAAIRHSTFGIRQFMTPA